LCLGDFVAKIVITIGFFLKVRVVLATKARWRKLSQRIARITSETCLSNAYMINSWDLRWTDPMNNASKLNYLLHKFRRCLTRMILEAFAKM
jgi:hypothetical protein